jgi:endogenous inhibitor of DNA gyrase (YacG/DUF329 family)
MSDEKRICAQCGKPLEGRDAKAIYCSTRCKNAAQYQRAKERKLNKEPKDERSLIAEPDYKPVSDESPEIKPEPKPKPLIEEEIKPEPKPDFPPNCSGYMCDYCDTPLIKYAQKCPFCHTVVDWRNTEYTSDPYCIVCDLCGAMNGARATSCWNCNSIFERIY